MKHSKFKWSFYAMRSVAGCFHVIFQAARDHLIPFSSPNANEFADKTDVLLRKGDWWWTVKIRFDF